MADGRFPFLSLILGFISNLTAYFQANLASLIFKLIFPGCGKTLSGHFRYRCQEAEGWISFSLTLFLPWFWHLSLFLRLWRTSQQYKPTPKKFKDGANLLFRGLIIANTYASSMRSRVSYRFLKRFIVYVWTGENAAILRVDVKFFENGEKKLRFQTNTDTCGQGLSDFLRRQRNKKDIILV